MAKLGESVYRPPSSSEAKNCRCMRNSSGVIELTVLGTGGKLAGGNARPEMAKENAAAKAKAAPSGKAFESFTGSMVAAPAGSLQTAGRNRRRRVSYQTFEFGLES